MFSAVFQVQRVHPEGLDNYNKVVHLYHCDVVAVTYEEHEGTPSTAKGHCMWPSERG